MKTKQYLFSTFIATSIFLGTAQTVMAESNPELWPVMKEAFFAKRDMQEATFIKIDAPLRAESGAQVPVTYTIDNAAANGVVIKNVYVFVDSNPIPLTATYHLTDALGDFHLSTRIRFETDGFVRLVGETADGKLYLASRAVRAAGGCGGTVEANDIKDRADAGKIKMRVEEPIKIGMPVTAVANIRHVMRTGLQRDSVSQGFLPAYYINKTEFKFNNKSLMTIDVAVGTAEDPYFKFNFVPKEPGKLEMLATDNEGKSFTHMVEVKS